METLHSNEYDHTLEMLNWNGLLKSIRQAQPSYFSTSDLPSTSMALFFHDQMDAQIKDASNCV